MELAQKSEVAPKDDGIDQALGSARCDIQEIDQEVFSLGIDGNNDIVDGGPEPHNYNYGRIKPETHERVFLWSARDVADFSRFSCDDDVDSDIENHGHPEKAVKMEKAPIGNLDPTPCKSGTIEIPNQCDHREGGGNPPTKDVIEFFERLSRLLAEHGVTERKADACCPEDTAQLKNVQQESLDLAKDAGFSVLGAQ